jgi:hypothetical protein
VIAGLTSALVGIAMIAMAGKASATDHPAAHDHTATPVPTMEQRNAGAGESDSRTKAADLRGATAEHASHQAHHDHATPPEKKGHDEQPADTED